MIRFISSIFAVCMLAMASACAQSAPEMPSIDVKTDIVYASAETETGDMDLLLDLYRPVDRTAPLPVFIYMHGGRWENGSKDWLPRQISTMEWFASRGYAAIAFNYRLRGDNPVRSGSLKEFERMLSDQYSDHAELSELVPLITVATEDLVSLLRWVDTEAGEYDLDTDRIIIAGGSAGAITTLLATYSPVDPIPADVTAPAALVSFSGGLFGLEDGLREDAMTPALFVHGTADERVNFQQSVRARRALASRGVPSEVIPLEGLRHSLGYPTLLQSIETDTGQPLLDRIDEWIDTVLAPGAEDAKAASSPQAAD